MNNIHELKSSQLSESYIKNHFPVEYEDIINQKPDEWKEKLYWYLNNINEFPKCPICGKETKFHGSTYGYSKFCGSKCKGVTEIGVEKKLSGEKKIKKYKSWKQTCDTKYGCEWTKTREFKSKSEQTKMQRHGDAHFVNLEKMKATCLRKYGVENASKSQFIADKISQIKRAKFTELNTNNDFLYYDDKNWVCKCPHPECNQCIEKTYIISRGHYHTRKFDGTELCTKLLPIQPQWSSLELKIRSWLDELDVEYTTNDRKFGTEMDIYIPDLKLAIECNGSYWHSSQFKSPLYHINKSLLLADNGVRCVFVWDDYLEEDIKEFLNAVIKGEELNPWKQKWFAGLDGWPADFGLVDGDWEEHKCMHGKFECYDAGEIVIEKGEV